MVVNSKNSTLQGLGRLGSTPIPVGIVGCTDPNAMNYNANATTDDGTCVIQVNGCTDESAHNWTQGANTDDGSCVYAGCMDSAYAEFDIIYTVPAPAECVTEITYGCTNTSPLSINDGYVYPAFYNSGPYITPCNGLNGDLVNNPELACTQNQGVDNCCCISTVVGCMDQYAQNYDPNANVQYQGTATPCTVSPNTCNYDVYGCMDNYTIDGSGPGQNGATNYDPAATCPDTDTPCEYVNNIPGCFTPGYWNTDCETGNSPGGNPYIPCTDGVTYNDATWPCISFVYGCMDESAIC